jgi:hypothetical protein
MGAKSQNALLTEELAIRTALLNDARATVRALEETVRDLKAAGEWLAAELDSLGKRNDRQARRVRSLFTANAQLARMLAEALETIAPNAKAKPESVTDDKPAEPPVLDGMSMAQAVTQLFYPSSPMLGRGVGIWCQCPTCVSARKLYRELDRPIAPIAPRFGAGTGPQPADPPMGLDGG